LTNTEAAGVVVAPNFAPSSTNQAQFLVRIAF